MWLTIRYLINIILHVRLIERTYKYNERGKCKFFFFFLRLAEYWFCERLHYYFKHVTYFICRPKKNIYIPCTVSNYAQSLENALNARKICYKVLLLIKHFYVVNYTDLQSLALCLLVVWKLIARLIDFTRHSANKRPCLTL